MPRNSGTKRLSFTEQAEIVLLGKEMLENGARTRTIMGVCGVSEWMVHKLIRATHKVPQVGAQPCSFNWFRTASRMAQANIVAHDFKRIVGAISDDRVEYARRFLTGFYTYTAKVWKTFHVLGAVPVYDGERDTRTGARDVMDINRYWHLLRMIETGHLVLQTCDCCGSGFIEESGWEKRRTVCFSCSGVLLYACARCFAPLQKSNNGSACCSDCRGGAPRVRRRGAP